MLKDMFSEAFVALTGVLFLFASEATGYMFSYYDAVIAPRKIAVTQKEVWFYKMRFGMGMTKVNMVWRFDKVSEAWDVRERIPGGLKTKREVPFPSDFKLPQLSKEKVLHYRKELLDRGYPRDGGWISWIEQEVGAQDKVGNKIWFGIKFYDSEGTTGVGGIGYYDLRNHKLILRRPEFILDSSVSALVVDGEKMWIGTLRYGEFGPSSTRGLICYNWTTEKVESFSPGQNDLCGLIIFDIAKDGDDIWVAHEFGVSRYRKAKRDWENYFLEKSTAGVFTINKLSAEEIYLETIKGILQAKEWRPDAKADMFSSFMRRVEKWQIKKAYTALEYLYESIHATEMDKFFRRAIPGTALSVISKLDDPRGEEMLERLWKGIHKADPLYICLLEIFAERKDERALPFIVDSLDDPARRIRANAVRFLAFFPGDKTEKLILKMFDDPEQSVRNSARRALIKLRGKGAIPLLMQLLENEEKFEKAHIIYDLEKVTGMSFGRYGGARPPEREKIEAMWKQWWEEHKDDVEYR